MAVTRPLGPPLWFLLGELTIVAALTLPRVAVAVLSGQRARLL